MPVSAGSKIIPFNKKIVLAQEPTWICIPSVVAGTNVSGVVVLDLKKSTNSSIPLD